MSESESFINEVSEEVRRDRLFGLLRRYGWIAVASVLLIVAGASVNEWRKAQARAEAERFGDSLLAGLSAPGAEGRAEAVAGVPADGPQTDLRALLVAAERLAAEEPAAAAEALRPLAQGSDVPAAYSDLAALKLVLLGEDGVDATTRAQLLERLAQPGAPYRVLALEQRALALAAEGQNEEARAAAEALLEQPGLTQAVAQRVSQLLLALGGPEGEDEDDAG